MPLLIIVDDPQDWPLNLPGAETVAARDYLTNPAYSAPRGVKVINLCRSYRYQSVGYYVSLLAAARGHRPMPEISAIQEIHTPCMARLISQELDQRIQKSLAPLKSDQFTLSIYFGVNMAKRYDALARDLFNHFRAPLLRAEFDKRGKWILKGVGIIAAKEIPAEHHDFVIEAAQRHFSGRRRFVKRRLPRLDLAILHDPKEREPPSNPKALRRFARAAEELDIGVEFITRHDYGRLGEFDALFIRETTAVNHHTYHFARRGAAEGLVTVDAAEDILRCANKVFLAERLERARIATPRTLIVMRENLDAVTKALGLPCVLKQPDSAFSLGVVKVESAEALREQGEKLLERSDLIIAQAFQPTEFDWRVTLFDRQPLFVCRYFMAPGHWQIIQQAATSERQRYGEVETLAVEQAPASVVRTAQKAAALIGDGLYGVDLKMVDGVCSVVEINDNPNIDAGFEDQVLGEALYRRIMEVFLARVERRRQRVVGTP